MTTVTETPGGDLTEGGRRAPWLLIGGGVAAAALLGGGVYAALAMSGGGDQPDSVLPATAAAYAQVDLDPSAGQKVTAVRFFQGLDPEVRASIDRDWRAWVWEQLQEEGDLPPEVSYAEDVEPWLGDRAGVALIPTGEGEEPVAAVALQVKDGQAALDFLDGLDAEGSEDLAYYLADDYVVLTQQGSLELVRSAAEAGTLDEHEPYTSDMDDLGEAGIVAMWADAARASEIDPSAFDADLGLTEEALGLPERPDVTGRMAGTLRFSADAIELHGITRGVSGVALPASTGATRLVGELPADTAVALSVENGAQMVQATWDYYADLYPDEVAEVSGQAEEAGFTLPDDLRTVLGESMTLSVGPGIVDAVTGISPTEPSVPALPLGYRVTTDTARLQTMLSENGLGAGFLTVREDDGTLTVGTDQAYVDSLADGTGETLGSTALFSAAVADSGSSDTVFFVDVAAFEQYYLPEVTDEDARAALEQLGAVGMSGTTEGEGAGRFTLRLVADQE
ncbi:DUF3352 domain-containing protein [Ornithinimicrobium flavum]|uniref:DUF3352 domain-containing protein n=1 Tax=Ornithinimicrobium flavum TaxID=1288636 RepID=UPI00106F0DB1|nr:DUF3352 domain-containing protein [Ornithinimicrobium flavum]